MNEFIIKPASFDEREIEQIQEAVNDFYFLPKRSIVEQILKKKIYVAIKDKTLLGLLHFGYNKKKSLYKILMLYVKKQYRNQGVGTALWKYFLEKANPEPINVIALATAADDGQKHNSLGFWLKIGFKDIGIGIETKRKNKMRYLIYSNVKRNNS